MTTHPITGAAPHATPEQAVLDSHAWDPGAWAPETRRDIAYVRSNSYADLLHRTAARTPHKLAVVDGDRRVTYAQFDTAVTRCANALLGCGLVPGDRLALISRNCWEFAVLAYATARVGLVLVPVNFMLTAAEVAYILDHSGARGVVAGSEFIATADTAIDGADIADPLRIEIVAATNATPTAGWRDIAELWSVGDTSAPDVHVGDDDPIRLMYTSGTESRPKGVMLSSKSLISQYVSCIVDGGMSGDDVEVHALPMYHCAQLDCFFSTDVYLGATSIILPGPDPATLLATIETERVTKLFCPPTVWIALLRHPDFDTRDLSSLRKGYYGAAAMPIEVLRELAQRLPEVALWNFYGQTEMSPLATILRPHEQLSRAGSAGLAALNVETRIVDDQGDPVPVGQVGEIVHRSPHATLGYFRDETKTASAFAGGWFHSGDLGVLDADGFLSVVDRKKDMIKTGGENVASREVEEALYELDGVAEVAVFGVPHDYWMEAVTAVVVPKDGTHLTANDVHAFTAERLAGYKRPKFVVIAGGLPKNPSGKILKRSLRETYSTIAQETTEHP